MFIGLTSWPRATVHMLGGGSVGSLFGGRPVAWYALTARDMTAQMGVDADHGRRHPTRGDSRQRTAASQQAQVDRPLERLRA